MAKDYSENLRNSLRKFLQKEAADERIFISDFHFFGNTERYIQLSVQTIMVGLRNILVHEYGRIDRKRIYKILKEELPDLEEFKKQIIRFIKQGKHMVK